MRVWICGANSTKTSFNYFRTQMSVDDDLFIEYNSDGDLVQTIQKIKQKIERKCDEDTSIDLIGHSLGGVISVIIYHLGLKNVRSITTMSAPFGGITNHIALRLWFPKSIFKSFHDLETTYEHLINKPIQVPHLFIVTKRGSNPLFLGKKNDGVVSVASQMSIPNSKYVEVDLNHYEVLMSEEVIDVIKGFLKLNKKLAA